MWCPSIPGARVTCQHIWHVTLEHTCRRPDMADRSLDALFPRLIARTDHTTNAIRRGKLSASGADQPASRRSANLMSFSTPRPTLNPLLWDPIGKKLSRPLAVLDRVVRRGKSTKKKTLQNICLENCTRGCTFGACPRTEEVLQRFTAGSWPK